MLFLLKSQGIGWCSEDFSGRCLSLGGFNCTLWMMMLLGTLFEVQNRKRILLPLFSGECQMKLKPFCPNYHILSSSIVLGLSKEAVSMVMLRQKLDSLCFSIISPDGYFISNPVYILYYLVWSGLYNWKIYNIQGEDHVLQSTSRHTTYHIWHKLLHGKKQYLVTLA